MANGKWQKEVPLFNLGGYRTKIDYEDDDDEEDDFFKSCRI